MFLSVHYDLRSNYEGGGTTGKKHVVWERNKTVIELKNHEGKEGTVMGSSSGRL